MVSPIAPGNTTQRDALRWAFEQAQHLTATQHHVLLYLVSHAFYQEDNPEHAEVGQVLRQASYVDQIIACTGLSRPTIRRVLVDLQMAGYVQRLLRDDPDIYGQQPHVIHVLWEAEGLREGLRNGTRRLPDELMAVPSRPSKKEAPTPVLSIVKECSQ
jgi:glutathione S-transferase